MKYPVISIFRDKYTKVTYKVGVNFETNDQARATDLQKRKLIGLAMGEPKQEVQPELKHIGGGYYELPNGERVKGKETAIEMMNGGEEA